MKNIKNYLLMFILGGIIFSGISVYATFKAQADEIEYENGVSVKDKIDDLYSKTSSKKICLYVSGTKGSIGSKYLCDPGDGVARYFYILKNEGTTIKLIAERNITDNTNNATMSYNDAIVYFNENQPGYSIRQSWKNVIVDLPSAQDIAEAGGITGWVYDNATENDWSYFGVNNNSDTSKRSIYSWLYDYTIGCISRGNCSYESPDNSNYASGYWTKNKIANDDSKAWRVGRFGYLAHGATTSSASSDGIRPVITISANQLSN